jgi:hypothetical protein
MFWDDCLILGGLEMKEILIVMWAWTFVPDSTMARCYVRELPMAILPYGEKEWVMFNDSFTKPSDDLVKAVDETLDCFQISVTSKTVVLTVVGESVHPSIKKLIRDYEHQQCLGKSEAWKKYTGCLANKACPGGGKNPDGLSICYAINIICNEPGMSKECP